MDAETVERLTQRLWAVRRARDGVLSAALQLPSSATDRETSKRDHSADRGDRSADQRDHGDRSADRSGDGAEQLQRRRIDEYTSSVQRLREQRDTAAAHQRRLCRSVGAAAEGRGGPETAAPGRETRDLESGMIVWSPSLCGNNMKMDGELAY